MNGIFYVMFQPKWERSGKRGKREKRGKRGKRGKRRNGEREKGAPEVAEALGCQHCWVFKSKYTISNPS